MCQVHSQWVAALCGSKGDGEEQAKSQDLLQGNKHHTLLGKVRGKWLSVDQLSQSFIAPGRSGRGPHLTL